MDARDPIAMRAGRIASLAEAAETIFVGARIADVSKREVLMIDLLDCAVEMALRLEADIGDACYGDFPSGQT